MHYLGQLGHILFKTQVKLNCLHDILTLRILVSFFILILLDYANRFHVKIYILLKSALLNNFIINILDIYVFNI